MSEKQNSMQYYEDEIDLRELILALWKRKKMIISLTLVAGLIAGMFSMFVLSPVYETKLNIVISMPEKYNTRYGGYTLPISTNEQYINLIKSNNVLINTIKDMEYNTEEVNLEGLNKRISITKPEAKAGTVQNSFEVVVSSDNPQESLKLAQSLFNNYIDLMDAMTRERAVNYYYNSFSESMKSFENSLKSETEKLKSNEELLAQTPQTIESGKANLHVQGQLNTNNYYAVPFDTVNPIYLKIEGDIIESKQSINNIEESMRRYNKYLGELDIEKQLIINSTFPPGKS